MPPITTLPTVDKHRLVNGRSSDIVTLDFKFERVAIEVQDLRVIAPNLIRDSTTHVDRTVLHAEQEFLHTLVSLQKHRAVDRDLALSPFGLSAIT